MKKAASALFASIALCSAGTLASQSQQEEKFAWLTEPGGRVSYGTNTGCLVRIGKPVETGEFLQWIGRCQGGHANGEGTLAICSKGRKVVAAATGVMDHGEWAKPAIASSTTAAANCQPGNNAMPVQEASKDTDSQAGARASASALSGITHILEFKNRDRTEKLLCSFPGYIRINLGLFHGGHQDIEMAALVNLERVERMIRIQAGDKNEKINEFQVDGFFSCPQNSPKCDQGSNDGLLNATNCRKYSESLMQAYSELRLPMSGINRIVLFGDVEKHEFLEQMAEARARFYARKQADAEAERKYQIAARALQEQVKASAGKAKAETEAFLRKAPAGSQMTCRGTTQPNSNEYPEDLQYQCSSFMSLVSLRDLKQFGWRVGSPTKTENIGDAGTRIETYVTGVEPGKIISQPQVMRGIGGPLVVDMPVDYQEPRLIKHTEVVHDTYKTYTYEYSVEKRK